MYKKTKVLFRSTFAGLLLCFFMYRMFSAPIAILFYLYLARDELLVLARPVVDTLTVFAGKFDELIL